MDFGVAFSDVWTAVVGFLTGDLLGPMMIALGGIFIAFLVVSLFARVVGGRG